MIDRETFSMELINSIMADENEEIFLEFLLEHMDFVYHYYLKDEWFTSFAKPICGMYLYANIVDCVDENKPFCATIADLVIGILIFIYNCLEYESIIDIEELYSAMFITYHSNTIQKKTLDIHYLALELKQEYEETYNNMLYVFNMEKDSVEIEFYRHICPLILNYCQELLSSPGYHLLAINKIYNKHNCAGDYYNKIDWWCNIPQNRYKSFDEKIECFCSSLGGD